MPDDDTGANLTETTAADGALADDVPSESSTTSTNGHAAPISSSAVDRDEVPASERPRSSSSVDDLLRALRVTRAPDGGVVIAAPPDTADALLSLLRGVTELVAKSSMAASV